MKLFTDPRCLGHAVPGAPEKPERLERILAALEKRGTTPDGDAAIDPETARAAAIAVHGEAYVSRFERACRRGDALFDSADNPVVEDTLDAAWGAVASIVAATDWIAAGNDRRAFAAVRPPGHHAERETAMGFCYFANVAIAAERLVREHGVSRVAIVDFDVHHGNGTQHLFEERADVLVANTHQYPFYPGTGAASERGRGAGEGTTVNVPLPAGTGDEAYFEAFDGTVVPALREFAPEVVLVSAGFDAWRNDPLGGLALSREAFERLGRTLREVADESAEGRMLASLEGGYDVSALPGLVEAFLDGVG